MMKKASMLFTPEQKHVIVSAIQVAEKQTSAEIRVHIENNCQRSVLDRAVDVFSELRMDKTELRNGVLIYVAIKDRKAAIIGDLNVNSRVKREFWDECYAAMRSHFSSGDYTEGIRTAIVMLETELGSHFPYSTDDVNELPDEISFG